MHPIRVKIREVINRLEETEITFPQCFLLVVAFPLIRGVIESFTYLTSDSAWRLDSTVADLVGFYLLVILAFSLILSKLTGVGMVRIAKLGIFFIPLIVLPPIIDVIVSGSLNGLQMKYLTYQTPAELGWKSLTAYAMIFLPNQEGTPGCLGVALLTVLGTGLYTYMRTLSLGRAVAALLLCHFVMFIMGSEPAFTDLIVNGISGWINPARALKYTQKQNFILLLFVVAAVWYRAWDRERWRDLRSRFLSPIVLHGWILGLSGMVLGVAQQDWSFGYRVAGSAIMLLVAVLVMGAMTPAGRKTVPGFELLSMAWILFGTIVVSDEKQALFPIAFLLIRYVAERSPYQAGRMPILAGLLSAAGSAALFIWGFSLATGRLENFPMDVMAALIAASVLAQPLARRELGLEPLRIPGFVSEKRFPLEVRTKIAVMAAVIAFPLAASFSRSNAVWLWLPILGAMLLVFLAHFREKPIRWIVPVAYLLCAFLAVAAFLPNWPLAKALHPDIVIVKPDKASP